MGLPLQIIWQYARRHRRGRLMCRPKNPTKTKTPKISGVLRFVAQRTILRCGGCDQCLEHKARNGKGCDDNHKSDDRIFDHVLGLLYVFLIAAS